MQDGYADAVYPGMELAADFACTYYDALGDDEPFAEPVELPPVEALNIAVRWALSTGKGPAGLVLLEGATQRKIYNAGRETLLFNVDREPSARFARYANSGACDFCVKLETRGAVYHSRESAGEHTDFHDNCGCMIVVERG